MRPGNPCAGLAALSDRPTKTAARIDGRGPPRRHHSPAGADADRIAAADVEGDQAGRGLKIRLALTRITGGVRGE